MGGNSTRGGKNNLDARLSPPSYSQVHSDPLRESQAYMTSTTETTTTETTVSTTTIRTTTFFSLPLWRRRGGPPMSSSTLSEAPRADNRVGSEDGRIARTASCNADFNKELPDVPSYEESIDLVYARPDTGTGTMCFPSVQQQKRSIGRNGRASRSSTLLMPPQTQPTRTLAQAGLGIGLPYVMPSAAGSARRVSHSSPQRPRTAPRPTRLETAKEVRRVKSFQRIRSESTPGTQKSKEQQATPIVEKNGAPTVPDGGNVERKVVGKRASFWNRRRVQSLKDPPQSDAQQNAQLAPPPSLPAFRPISPMFPDRPIQSSPGSIPHLSTSQVSSKGKRSVSPQESSSLTDRSPQSDNAQQSGPSGAVPRSSSPLLERQLRPVQSSYISTSATSRFSLIDQRQARPRSMTNPPNVLQRLSKGFFNISSPSTPISSPTTSTNNLNDLQILSSPRHSSTLTRSSLSKSATEVPKPRFDEESPEVFLNRLEEAVSKAEIANILAGSGDAYYAEALRMYIDRFNFKNDPLDIALRKLLMVMGLPKETQQIDRVMEAFAARYVECNPSVFVSRDHPYILAFSLIMLHTDAFNKSNKRKMTKSDYIKNTKLVGVSTEVLDYFFDNIVFAPFIFIEDPVDVNGQRGFMQDGRTLSSGSGLGTPVLNGSTRLGRPNKVDAYYLITRNLLDGLRVDVETYIPLRNPYSYQGTVGSWNEAELRRSFARSEVIAMNAMDSRRMSSLPFFSMNLNGVPGPVVGNFAPPVQSDRESILSGMSSIRITKVGILNRKDDLLDGGKRASSRKWKELWSIILTGSQLLFYRDSSVALNIIVQSRSPDRENFPVQFSFLRPDELLSIKDAIAVYDSSYVKRDYVLRLVMPSGRQLLLQTENELQRNEWIAHINYASAFKTAGIRMRPVSPTESARMDRSSYIHGAPQIPSRRTPFEEAFDGEESRESIVDSNTPDDAEMLGDREASERASTNINSRSRIVLAKIRELESKIRASRTQLDSDSRLVHNLAILIPFRRSTGDQLQATIIRLGKNIRQLRLDIVKATCFRDVLTADLASEERERKSRHREESELRRRYNREDSPRSAVSLSIDKDGAMPIGPSRSLSRSDVSEVSHGRPASSICESFHSALDFGTDWPRKRSPTGDVQRRAEPMRSFEEVSPMATPSFEVPPGGSLGSGFFSSSSLAEPSSSDTSPSQPSVMVNKSPAVEQRISEEEAEDWDKTRAARRVSLVRVPEGLRTVDKGSKRESLRSKEPQEPKLALHEDIPYGGDST